MQKKILLSLFFALFVGEAAALGFTQQMDVKIGVFDAAGVRLDYQEKNQQFDIKAKVKTANFFDTLYPFVGEYESQGKVVNDGVVSKIYQTYTKSRSHVRTKKVLYDEKGKAYLRISDKDGKNHETPIKDVPKGADTGDLQSVFAELVYRFKKTSSCALNREVYDGKKHYRVISKDEHIERRYFDLRKQEETAHLCLVYIENLKDNNDNILWEVSANKPIKMWIGKDEKTKMPFVLEIGIDSTPLGALKVTPRSFMTE